MGSGGVPLVTGVMSSATHLVSMSWLNRCTASDARATRHTFVGQTKSIGEIAGGFAFAAVVRNASILVVLSTTAGLVACASAIVVWAGTVSLRRRCLPDRSVNKLIAVALPGKGEVAYWCANLGIRVDVDPFAGVPYKRDAA